MTTAHGDAAGSVAVGGARRRRWSGGAAALVAVWLAACAAPVPLPSADPSVGELPAPVPEWITHRVTDTDDGRRIELPLGAALAVSLRAPAAAGAGWVLSRQPANLTLTGRFSGPVWPPEAPAPRLAPPPVWQVFVFEAREPGDSQVAFDLVGSSAAVPSRRVRFTVGVRRE
jgi:hypothetical protein